MVISPTIENKIKRMWDLFSFSVIYPTKMKGIFFTQDSWLGLWKSDFFLIEFWQSPILWCFRLSFGLTLSLASISLGGIMMGKSKLGLGCLFTLLVDVGREITLLEKNSPYTSIFLFLLSWAYDFFPVSYSNILRIPWKHMCWKQIILSVQTTFQCFV